MSLFSKVALTFKDNDSFSKKKKKSETIEQKCNSRGRYLGIPVMFFIHLFWIGGVQNRLGLVDDI